MLNINIKVHFIIFEIWARSSGRAWEWGSTSAYWLLLDIPILW